MKNVAHTAKAAMNVNQLVDVKTEESVMKTLSSANVLQDGSATFVLIDVNLVATD